MAPRFESNMCNYWDTERGADALVCFRCLDREKDSEELDRTRENFLERLIERLTHGQRWVSYPQDLTTRELSDFLIYFVEPANAELMAGVEPPRNPLSFLWYLVSGGYGRMWRRRAELAQLSLATSYEFSRAIEIQSKVHAGEEMGRHIVEIACELGVSMPRNSQLPSLKHAMMSNARFSLDVK